MDGWMNLCTKGYLMLSEAKKDVVFTASPQFEICYICLIGRGRAQHRLDFAQQRCGKSRNHVVVDDKGATAVTPPFNDSF